MSPRQVDDCTPWEFAAAIEGWKRANGAPDDVKPPSPEEHDALVAKYG